MRGRDRLPPSSRRGGTSPAWKASSADRSRRSLTGRRASTRGEMGTETREAMVNLRRTRELPTRQTLRRARIKADRWLEYRGQLVFNDGDESYNAEPQAEGD